MRSVRALFVRLAHVFGRRRHAEEFDAELAAHIELHTEDNIRRGMPPDDARRTALAHLGGVDRMRQAYREQAGLPAVEQLTEDARHAVRSLARAPGFTLVALVTIALGVAGPTVMFVMAKQWILEPLPFAAPDRLVDVRNLDTASGNTGPVSVADFLDWQREATTLADLAAYRRADARLTGIERAERVRGAEITTNFFGVLGVEAPVGRVFDARDGESSAGPVTIISDTLWRRHFQSASDIVGRVIRLDGTDHTVIGVLRPAFQFTLLGGIDVWRPLRFDPPEATNRRTRSIRAVARLAPNASLDDARTEVSGIAARLATIYPDTNARRGVRVLGLADEVRLHHDAGFVVPILFGMMCLVLIVASTNVTNVMLARTMARRQEIAMRLALGASRARIARQWLVEHVLLFGVASVGAVALAMYGASWVSDSIPAENRQYLRNLGVLTLEPMSLAFAVAIGTACGALFGLLPAWKSSRADVNIDLKDAAARGSSGRGAARVRSALVVIEVALTLAFLVAAGLIVITTRNITRVDVGFEPRQLLTFQLALDDARYRSDAEIRGFYERLTSAIARISRVSGVAFATFVPFGTEGSNVEFFVDSQSDTPRSETPIVTFSETSPSYISTLGLRVKAGRALNADDAADTPRVAVINEIVAARHFAGRDPVGQRIRLRRDSRDAWVVVGIVANAKNFETTEPDEPQVYVPFAQSPKRDATVVIRAPGDLASLTAVLRDALAETDPDEPMIDVATMEDRINRATAPFRIIATFVAFFGAVTLLLAGVGLYGVVSYTFAQRTREIGVRMALGARRTDVAALVLKHLRMLLVAGIVPGLILARLIGQALSALLFGVTPADWRPYLGMTIALGLVATVAVLVPARRATRIDPMVALRYE